MSVILTFLVTTVPEAYLELCRKSIMELFVEKADRLKLEYLIAFFNSFACFFFNKPMFLTNYSTAQPFP